MKKIIPVLIFALLLCALAACTSTSTIEETYNGITRTETTTKNGDDVTTEIVYTDADGNELDPEIGEAAFEAAQAGDENPLETAMNAANAEEEPAEEVAPAEEETAEASGEPSDEELYTATVTFVNESDADIEELYIALEEDTTWGSNLLTETLAVGDEVEFDGTLTYAPDTAFEMDFVTADGYEAAFDAFDFSGIADPENVTITFTFEDGAYCFYIA